MDGDKIVKPKILVVGDSFMSLDPKHPGQHWSEMIDHYRVLNRAVPGSSQRSICLSLFENLQERPDVVVIGCTEPWRLEFQSNGRHLYDPCPITNCHQDKLTQTEQLAYRYWRATRNDNFEIDNFFIQLIGMFSFLEKIKINFVYSLESMGMCSPNKKLSKHFSEFDQNLIPFNLALSDQDCWNNQDPIFHVNNHGSQKKFAQAVTETINKLQQQS